MMLLKLIKIYVPPQTTPAINKLVNWVNLLALFTGKIVLVNFNIIINIIDDITNLGIEAIVSL